MKVIAVPTRLRWALLAFALCIPLASLETGIALRAQWWRLPYQAILIWSAACAAAYLVLSWWIARGYRWALVVMASCGALWVLASASYAIRLQNYGIAFFTLFLALFWIAMLSWIRFELQRTFFDPKMTWFHGLPRGIPGLSCRIADSKSELRVSRIDEDGAFLFTPVPELIEGLRSFIDDKAARVPLKFIFRGSEVDCRGFAVVRLEGGAGAGFQFAGMSPDSRKDLSDFVETLRGEGHV